MNVVQSDDDCQNVLPKLNIQFILIAVFNSLANAPVSGVSLPQLKAIPEI